MEASQTMHGILFSAMVSIYVDATWGDPIFLGEDNGYQIPNLIAYDYLCCSEKELEKNTYDQHGLCISVMSV